MDLSRYEIKVLKVLEDHFEPLEEIAKKAQLSYYETLRTLGFLKIKGLAEIQEKEEEQIQLTDLGKKYLEIGLPEKRLLNILKQKKKIKIEELQKIFPTDELQIAIGILKKKGAIKIEKGEVIFVKEVDFPEEKVLLKILEGKASKEDLQFIKNRKKLYEIKKIKKYYAKITEKGREILKSIKPEEKIERYTRGVLISKEWRNKKFREYDLSIPVKPAKLAKKHPYLEFLDRIREELVAMGFQEMEEYNIIISHFWDLDVLFIPQDHPAGELSLLDSFIPEKPEEIEDFPRELLEKVKKQHLKYFGFWEDKIAKSPILISQVTAVSARKLLTAKIPGKYFAIEKVFRYDTIDKTHFIEFNQLDGIVLDESLTFRDLLGVLKELLIEIVGAEDVKFYPAYFPFTEPSVEAYAKHPKLGWIEVGGAGMFREELLEPFGINVPVIAWGLGIDRLAMINLGINDIRDLHTRDLRKYQ